MQKEGHAWRIEGKKILKWNFSCQFCNWSCLLTWKYCSHCSGRKRGAGKCPQMLISPDILQVDTQRFQEGSCCDGGIHHSRLHITVHWASGPNVFFFFFCLSPLLVSTSFSFFLSSFYQNASKIQLFNDNLIFWNSGKFIILNLFSQKKKKKYMDCWLFPGFLRWIFAFYPIFYLV